MNVQGGAVTVLFVPDDGRASARLPPDDEPPELDPPWAVHGGTITVVTAALVGITSWFCCDPPDELLDELLDELDAPACAPPPPGVITIVLAGGGGGVLEPPEELLEELEELLDELLDDELVLGAHGWIASVSVSPPFGTMISFEPGGGCFAPGLVV